MDLADGAGGLVVLGMTWQGAAAALRLRRPGADAELRAAVGLELRYRVPAEPHRHCLGHRSPSRRAAGPGPTGQSAGGYVVCDNPPQVGERLCVGCAVAEAEWAGSLHHAHTRRPAELDAVVARHLDQPNVLYLAAFRDGSVKVGTSTEQRTRQRLIEQGAWRAVVVATTGDGVVVRRLEDLVSLRLGLPQSVSVKRKVAGLVSPVDDQRLLQRLRPFVTQVHELIGSDPALEGAAITATDEPWTSPSADDRIWDRLHLYPARLDRGRHHVALAAMSGRVAVLTRPGIDDHFAADLSPLFGLELEMGDHQPDALVVQDSLF